MRRFFFGSATAGFGTVSLLLVLVLVIFGPLISPHSVTALSTDDQLLPPSLQHFFGTDEVGRDLFVRVAVGGRTSILISLGIVAIAGLIGLAIGSWIGFLGKSVEFVVIRICDALQAFPLILLAMLIAYTLGRGVFSILVALSVAYIPYFVKLARGLALSFRTSGFVKAARAQGAGTRYLLARHVVPLVVPAVLTQMTMAVGEAILAQAGLSILGLGAQPPAPEWGATLTSSTQYALSAWWYPIFPGIVIVLASASFNFLGDSLRENPVTASGAASRPSILTVSVPSWLRRPANGNATSGTVQESGETAE